jgi:hypothetical protein
MIWLMIQILPGNCITCLSPEFVVFFSVQTGVTMLVMVTLTILWIFVLVKKIDFQRHIVEDIVSEVESIQEPLPFYTKEELPSYDEVIPETRDLENPPVEREP